MKHTKLQLLAHLLQKSRAVEVAEGYDGAMAILEGAHVQYQVKSLAHTLVHFRMLCLAVKHRKWFEVFGQIPRILLAAPGSLCGLAPRGNVGSTRMGIFEKAKP